MKITSIQKLPTSVNIIPDGCRGVHESTLKAYQILEKTKYFLQKSVPNKIILELIYEMEIETEE